MNIQLFVRISVLSFLFVCVIGFIYYLKPQEQEGDIDISSLKDRNQYISKYNKRICKYDIVEMQIRFKSNTNATSLKLVDGNWIGRGDAPLELVQKSINDFCNIKIRDEVDLEMLKAPLEWSEDIEFVFSDSSHIQVQISKKGIIKIGTRHYFTTHLLELINAIGIN